MKGGTRVGVARCKAVCNDEGLYSHSLCEALESFNGLCGGEYHVGLQRHHVHRAAQRPHAPHRTRVPTFLALAHPPSRTRTTRPNRKLALVPS